MLHHPLISELGVSFRTLPQKNYRLMPPPSPAASPEAKRKKVSPEDDKKPEDSSLPPVVVQSSRPTQDPKRQLVEALADALVQAAKSYKQQDQKALSKGEHYDGLVKVDLPAGGDHSLLTDGLGDACSIAKLTVPVRGKLKVVAFPNSGEVFVRQVASGHTHGLVVGHVVGQFAIAAGAFSDFVGIGTDGLYGITGTLISAPDVTVQSFGRPGGAETGNSEYGPIFFAEAEHGNRSLQELVRHLGMLLVNFPNLHGVLGIKGEKDSNGKEFDVLILVEWRDRAQQPQPQVTHLIDFGPDQYSGQKKRSINAALQLPLPRPAGTLAQSGVHGLGAATPLPVWTQFANGMDGDNPAIIRIPPTLVFTGAHSTGSSGTVIDIPEEAVGVTLNLKQIASLYRR